MKTEEQRKAPWKLARLAKYKEVPWRLHKWQEEVSRIEIQDPVGDAIQFKLHAFGIGMPAETLDISVKHVPEMQLDFGIDREGMEKLAIWLVEAMYLLDSLRERKEREIRKAKRKLVEMHNHTFHHEWHKKSASK